MSVGLLTGVLILLVGVFLGGLSLMERSEVHTAASSIGREVMETLEDEGGFSAVPDGTFSFDGSVPDPKLGGFPPDPYPLTTRDGREYTVKVEVQSLTDELRAVLVTVSWETGRIQLEKAFNAANSAH